MAYYISKNSVENGMYYAKKCFSMADCHMILACFFSECRPVIFLGNSYFFLFKIYFENDINESRKRFLSLQTFITLEMEGQVGCIAFWDSVFHSVVWLCTAHFVKYS